MYRKEDRERILGDLIESGLPVATFCAQPGRPTRHTVTTWLKQAEAGELDIPERYVKGRCQHYKHTHYPETTKKEALALYAKGMKLSHIRRRLGIASSSQITSWIKAKEKATMAPKKEGAMEEIPLKPKDIRAAKRATWDKSGTETAEEAWMQNAVLREMIRDPKVVDPEKLSNKAKAELGERLRRESGFLLKEVLRFLKISKSSYAFAVKRNKELEARKPEVTTRVRLAFEYSNRTYGYRRIHSLIKTGFGDVGPMHVTEREVRDAMREGGMKPKRTRTRCYDSYKGEPDSRPANLPLRKDGTHNFFAPAPGRLAVTDVTEFKCGGKKVYLSPIIDCFDGMPAAWSISEHPDSELCDSSLKGYLESLVGEGGALVLHTDGGGQYRANSWKAICEEAGVTRSMSRKGRCPDNARAEGFFGVLKEEFYYTRDWSQTSPERFMEELNDYLVWYREERLKKFSDESGTYYDTLINRRKRLGYTA